MERPERHFQAGIRKSFFANDMQWSAKLDNLGSNPAISYSLCDIEQIVHITCALVFSTVQSGDSINIPQGVVVRFQ